MRTPRDQRDWFFLAVGWLAGFVNGLLIAALLAGCVTAVDYSVPGVAGTQAAAIEECRTNPYLPCGWVFAFGEDRLEWCLPWEDRSPYYKLLETVESLYGKGERAALCYWSCPPPPKGCNTKTTPGGCWCGDEVMP